MNLPSMPKYARGLLPMPSKGSTYIMSDSRKEAIRQARKGFVPTPEHRRKISQANKGLRRSELTRQHIARARLRK